MHAVLHCCGLHLRACDGAQVWLLFGQVHEVWKCQASLSPGTGCAVCRASRFLLLFFYVSACPCPCSTPALAGAPAGCRCEHALPPALLARDPSHTLCRHTKPWPQGSERTGHPLATVVPTGLFPSICLGCIPVLTPAPELLPVPWAETCTGCWIRAGLWGDQAGMGPLLGGERIQWEGDTVPYHKNRLALCSPCSAGMSTS